MNHPQFELNSGVNLLIFDSICRAAKAGVEATEILLGPEEMQCLDLLIEETGDLLPADLEGDSIAGGIYFGLRVRLMSAAGAAAR